MKTLKQTIVAQALANVLIPKEKVVTIEANWIPCTQAEMDSRIYRTKPINDTKNDESN